MVTYGLDAAEDKFTFDVKEVTGKRGRDASPPKRTVRPRLDLDGTIDAGIQRKRERLREMGVEHDFYILLGKRLEDMTDAEKKRLNKIKLEFMVESGCWEFRENTAKHWLANQHPIYITDPVNHATPPWYARELRWHRLWWENSPFTFPGDVYGDRLVQALPHAQRWVDNVFNPNRTGRPSRIIFELLVECKFPPIRGSPQVVRENCEALCWVFLMLRGDFSRLEIKVRFLRFRRPNQDPGHKRDLPIAAKSFETAVVAECDRWLEVLKKHIDGEPGFEYNRFMNPILANDPNRTDVSKQRLVVYRMARLLERNIERSWLGWELETGFIKFYMMSAFGLENEARMVRECRRFLNPMEVLDEDEWPSWM